MLAVGSDITIPIICCEKSMGVLSFETDVLTFYVFMPVFLFFSQFCRVFQVLAPTSKLRSAEQKAASISIIIKNETKLPMISDD